MKYFIIVQEADSHTAVRAHTSEDVLTPEDAVMAWGDELEAVETS